MGDWTAVCSTGAMAWGKGGSMADEWIGRLGANDPTFRELHVLRFRQLNEDDVVALCGALEKNTHMAHLAASGHRLTGRALEAVSAMLSTNRALRHLAIGDSELGDVGVAAIEAGLLGNGSLEVLDLDFKGLGLGAAGVMARVLANRFSGLVHLNLARNGLADDAVAVLAEGMRGNTRLMRLDLADNAFTAAALVSLGGVLPTTGVGVLSLSGNNLAGQDVAAAREFLSDESPVTDLFMDRCSLGNDVAAACASGLGRLRRLSLRDCGIGIGGATGVAAGVAQCATLQVLDLSENPVCDAGLTALCVGLTAAACAVTRLDVTHCGLGVDSLAALLTVSGAHMTHINMFANHVGDALRQLIDAGADDAVWTTADSLVDLDLGGNGISDE